VEALLPGARRLASEPPLRGQSNFPRYGIPAGQKALIVFPSNYDRLVVDAISLALREKGVTVDHAVFDITGSHLPLPERDGTPPPGELEAGDELESIRNRNNRPGKMWFIDHARRMGYKLVIEGPGGPLVYSTEGITDFEHQHIQWPNRYNFFFRTSTPSEIRRAIDNFTMAPLLEGGDVRVTDPEGTDLTFTIDPQLYSISEERERRPRLTLGHLWGVPQLVINRESNARGVIAGTANHTGMYPTLKLYLERHKVVTVEGGGRYGDFIREIIERSKNIQWPEKPGPGFAWLVEAGIGTEPAVVPGWSWYNGEVRRSGVIHFGIGVNSQTPKFRQFIQDRGLPSTHVHVHLRFPTYEIKNSKGKVVRIIDKGRLTAFDDPEVRRVATKFGDPDKWLRNLWVPAVPGINYPGDYARDYTPDPVAWQRKWKSVLEQSVDRVVLYGDRMPKDPIFEI